MRQIVERRLLIRERQWRLAFAGACFGPFDSFLVGIDPRDRRPGLRGKPFAGLAFAGPRNDDLLAWPGIGEVRDFADYSALFSPGGFRILGFTARFIACQKWGVQCSSGFGRSTNRSWDIDWDPTDRTLYITRPAQPSNFPAEMMTAKLAEVMGD